MSFGGAAPFPKRLGVASDTSISPAQWNALGRDVAAIDSPIAVLYITTTSTGGTVSGLCRGGTDVSAIAVTSQQVDNVRTTTVDIGNGYADAETGEPRRWSVLWVDLKRALAPTAANQPTIIGTQVTWNATLSAGATDYLTLIVWGQTEQRCSGDYGASPTKESSLTEGEIPYAWIWLQETQATRGDAFSIAPGSFTQWENLARARVWAYCQRLAERHAANQIPLQADQSIGRWAKLLDVSTADDRDWQVQRKAHAKWVLTMGGVHADSLQSAAELIFGQSLVQIHWYPGTLDEPPPATFWPAGEIGPGTLDIGNGVVWTSKRYHFAVELSAPTEAERIRLSSGPCRDFDNILNSALSGVCIWSYSFSAPGAFRVGISRLGLDSL